MPEPTPLRGPRIRRAPLPHEARTIVRGDSADVATDIHQAENFLRRFPYWGHYGLSAYYAGTEADVDDLAADQLERFRLLGIFELDQLQARGFAVVPTFRTPHVTIAFDGDIHQRIDELRDLRIELRPNPYHDGEP